MRRRGYICPDEVLLSKDLNSTEKVLFTYLVNRLYNSTQQYGEDLTQPELAEALNTTVRTISSAIKNLEEKGFIEIKRIKNPENNRYKNIYTINWISIELK